MTRSIKKPTKMKKKDRKYRTTKKKLLARRTFKKKNENQQRGGSNVDNMNDAPPPGSSTSSEPSQEQSPALSPPPPPSQGQSPPPGSPMNGVEITQPPPPGSSALSPPPPPSQGQSPPSESSTSSTQILSPPSAPSALSAPPPSAPSALSAPPSPRSAQDLLRDYIIALSKLSKRKLFFNDLKNICNRIVFILLYYYGNLEDNWENTYMADSQTRDGLGLFYRFISHHRHPVRERGTVNNGGDSAIQVMQGYELVSTNKTSIMRWLNQTQHGKRNFFTLLSLYVENIRIRELMLNVIKEISTAVNKGNRNSDINGIINEVLKSHSSNLSLKTVFLVENDFFALMLIAFIKSESEDEKGVKSGAFGFIFVGDTTSGKHHFDIKSWNDLIPKIRLPIKTTNEKKKRKKKESLILNHTELPDKIQPDQAVQKLSDFFQNHNPMIATLIEIYSPPPTTESIRKDLTRPIDQIFGLVDVMKLLTDIDDERRIKEGVVRNKSWGVWDDDITVSKNTTDGNLDFNITCKILPQGYLSLMIDLYHDFESGRGTATTSKATDVVQLLDKMMVAIKDHLIRSLPANTDYTKGVTLKTSHDFTEFINRFEKMNETSHSICSQIIQSGGSSIIQKHYEESTPLGETSMGPDPSPNPLAAEEVAAEEMEKGLSNIYMLYHDGNGTIFSSLNRYASLIGDTRVSIPIPIGDRKETGVFDTANFDKQINTLYSASLNPIESLDGGYGGAADTPRIDSQFNGLVKTKMQNAGFRINLPIPIRIDNHDLPETITPYLILDRDTKNWRLFIPIDGYDKLNVAAASDDKKRNRKRKRKQGQITPANEVVDGLTAKFRESRVRNVNVEINDTHLIITFFGKPGMSISFLQALVGFLEDPRLCLLKTVTDHLFHTTGSVNQIVSRHVLFDILSDSRIVLPDKLKMLTEVSLFSHVFSIDFGAAGGMATHNHITDHTIDHVASHLQQNPELLELFNILNPIEYPVLSGIWARKTEMKYQVPTETRDPQNKTQGTRVIGTLFDRLAENPEIINNISLFQESITQAIIDEAKGEPSFERIECELIEPIKTSKNITLHFEDYLLHNLKILYVNFKATRMFKHEVRKFISTEFCKDQFMTIGLKISKEDYVKLKRFLMENPVPLSEDQTIRLEGSQNVLRHLLLFTRIFCGEYPRILIPNEAQGNDKAQGNEAQDGNDEEQDNHDGNDEEQDNHDDNFDDI